MRVQILAALAALTVACASPSTDRQEAGATVSICSILAAPGDYDGREIAIRGQISTDYFEYSGMRDPGCPQRVISLGPQNIVESGLQELEARLGEIRNQPDAHVEVTAIGVLDWRPGQVPVLVIMATRYTDIVVVN